MTLCPIALAVGCQKCPALKICPLKRVLGDQPKLPPPEVGKQAVRAATKEAPKKTAKGATRKTSAKPATSRRVTAAKAPPRKK